MPQIQFFDLTVTVVVFRPESYFMDLAALTHCSKKPKVPFQGAPPRLICVMISWTMVMFNNTKEIFLVEGKFDHFFGQK